MASQAYRQILKTGFHTERVCGISEGGLVQHLRRRWREQTTVNLEAGYTHSEDPRQHQELSNQLSKVDDYCHAMMLGEEVPAIQSMLSSLALGVGSPAYVARVEHGVMQYVNYETERRARKEGDETVGEQRQNRVLVQALIPIAKTLHLVHQHHHTQQDLLNELGAFAQKTSSGTKDESRITHHCVGHAENETMLVEVDTAANKQTIYLTAEPYDVDRDGDTEVETLEPQNAKGIWCHAGWYRVAQRYVHSLLEETPVHKSRGTTVVGHGSGGAVAVGVALMLQQRGFEIRNVVTFGGCKYATRVFERLHSKLNILRIVMAKDPLPLVPTTGNDFENFVHYGEKFSLYSTRRVRGDIEHQSAGGLADMLEDDLEKTPAAAGLDAESMSQGDDSSIGFKTFSMQHYLEMMRSDKLEIDYHAEEADIVEDGRLPLNPDNVLSQANGVNVTASAREPQQHPKFPGAY